MSWHLSNPSVWTLCVSGKETLKRPATESKRIVGVREPIIKKIPHTGDVESLGVCG